MESSPLSSIPPDEIRFFRQKKSRFFRREGREEPGDLLDII